MTVPEQHANLRYAEESKLWLHGQKTEDELLQRIWNLASDVTSLAERADTLERERDEARQRLTDATLRWYEGDLPDETDRLVTLVRIGFLLTVDGERATPDVVQNPDMRDLLMKILQAKDTEAARDDLAGPQTKEPT